MSLFARLVKPVPSTRRAYSFFSSKSGGGRYFNSAKPPKAVPTTAASRSPSSAVDTASSAEELKAVSPPPSPSLKTDDLRPLSATPVFAPSHPAPTLEALTLHQFFAQHRPLLNLGVPVSALFEPPPTPQATAPVGTIDNPPEATPEADADSAQLLSRARVMNRLGGLMDWQGVLGRLGDRKWAAVAQSVKAEVVELDSTKRKRKKKMSKHKYKKRRKLQRAERRRMGK